MYRLIAAFSAMLALMLIARTAVACPFCDASKPTLSEEIASADVALVAELVRAAKAKDPTSSDEPVGRVPKARFKILEFIKGEELLGKTAEIEVLYFGRPPQGTKFLIVAIQDTLEDEPSVTPKKSGSAASAKSKASPLNWSLPIELSDQGVKYLKQVVKLPKKGPTRLKFFLSHLESDEDLLSIDAYNEFAIASYDDVTELKPHLDRKQLLKWIGDPNISNSHRRLYLTMLGVCGTKEEVPMLEKMLRDPTAEMRLSLDAMIACYLVLTGPDGLSLVEDLYLKSKDAEYTHTYAAVMAVRFHGEQTDFIPKKRLAESLEHLLARKNLADLVIPDLARWKDWDVMPRLVKMFKEADPKKDWVRAPIINYLQVCPLPAAKKHLEELKKLDPEAYKRASLFTPFGGQPASSQQDDSKKGDKKKDEETKAGGEASRSGSPKALPLEPLAAVLPPGSSHPASISAAAGSPAPDAWLPEWFDWKLAGMIVCVLGLAAVRWSLRRPKLRTVS